MTLFFALLRVSLQFIDSWNRSEERCNTLMASSAFSYPQRLCGSFWAKLKHGWKGSCSTCDIWGLRLISFKLMVWGRRLFRSWHSSTPSRKVCARSNTCALSATTRWFSGSTLQLISHIAHCLQYSMFTGPSGEVRESCYSLVMICAHAGFGLASGGRAEPLQFMNPPTPTHTQTTQHLIRCHFVHTCQGSLNCHYNNNYVNWIIWLLSFRPMLHITGLITYKNIYKL